MNSKQGTKLRSRRAAINTFFPCLLAAGLAVGCATTPEAKQEKEEKEEVAAIRLHLEAKDDAPKSRVVSVLRSNPVTLSVDTEPFLDERDVVRARLVDALGGTAIAIDCTFHGRLALEMTSVSRIGRRMAVVSTWTTGKDLTETRWLAAPIFREPLRDGAFSFIADCSREEAEHIVRGLNNVAIKLENQPKPPKAAKTKAKAKQDAKPAAPKPDEDPIKAFKEAR